jgi:hypothetical protein
VQEKSPCGPRGGDAEPAIWGELLGTPPAISHSLPPRWQRHDYRAAFTGPSRRVPRFAGPGPAVATFGAGASTPLFPVCAMCATLVCRIEQDAGPCTTIALRI